MKRKLKSFVVSLLATVLCGCPRPFTVPEPGSDYALIGDHSADERTMEFDYTLLEMDGLPVRKEKIPFGVDMNARTIANVGQRTFKVRVERHRRYPDAVPHEVTFGANVRGGTTYFVGTRDGLPVLVECEKVRPRKQPNQAPEPTPGSVTPRAPSSSSK